MAAAASWLCWSCLKTHVKILWRSRGVIPDVHLNGALKQFSCMVVRVAILINISVGIIHQTRHTVQSKDPRRGMTTIVRVNTSWK